jgi:hypothetical protein
MVSIMAADTGDLLIGTLEIPATAADEQASGAEQSSGVSGVLGRVRQDSGLMLGAIGSLRNGPHGPLRRPGRRRTDAIGGMWRTGTVGEIVSVRHRLFQTHSSPPSLRRCAMSARKKLAMTVAAFLVADAGR